MIRALTLSLVLLLAACVSTPSRADPPNPAFEAAIEACLAAATDPNAVRACYGVSARPCIEEGMGATMAYALCWSNEADVWERRAASVQARLAQRDPGRVESLEISVAAFAAFVEAECAYRGATFDGGSGAQPAMAQCAAELWMERVLMLEETERGY
ncbi:MAG: lysozyme inhibitor LprI family protein [Hyphomonadaceae bacterium]